MKQWWQSSTIWFHTIMSLFTTAAVSITFLQPVLSVKQYAIAQFVLALVQTVGGVLLRFSTTTPVVDRRSPEQPPIENPGRRKDDRGA